MLCLLRPAERRVDSVIKLLAMSQLSAQAGNMCRQDVSAMSAHAESGAQVAASCKEHGAKNVEIYSVDLTSSKDIDQLCKDLLSKHKVDVLVSS